MKEIKILTASEMKAVDDATFNTIGVPAAAVMESAGRAVGLFLADNFLDYTQTILVFCGPGNNGGDGYVLARCLHNLGFKIVVFSLKPIILLKSENAIFASACLKSEIEILDISNLSFNDIILQTESLAPAVIVDAIFGTGFKEEPRDCPKEAILAINSYKKSKQCLVMSIDLPSGINADQSKIPGIVVETDLTFAIQTLKPAHVLFPAAEVCGEVFCFDVGISINTDEYKNVTKQLLLPEKIKKIIQDSSIHKADTHKGKKGHLALIGGSAGKFGAIKLSAEAALRCGAGLGTIIVENEDFKKISFELNELMAVPLAEDKSFWEISLKEILKKKQCLLIGPGLGTDDHAKEIFQVALKLARELTIPTIIDADGLNILSELELELPKNTILTPHPGEMSRLLKLTAEQIQNQRIDTAILAAKRFSATVILKGAFSIIADIEQNVYVNPFASPVLSTAGSGDVLSGVIGAFLCQGYNEINASVVATYLHGLSGVMWEKNSGFFGALASDIALYTAQSLNHFLREEQIESDFSVKRVFNPIFI